MIITACTVRFTVTYSDGWGDGIVEFDEMPARFDELEEFINDIEATGEQ